MTKDRGVLRNRGTCTILNPLFCGVGLKLSRSEYTTAVGIWYDARSARNLGSPLGGRSQTYQRYNVDGVAKTLILAESAGAIGCGVAATVERWRGGVDVGRRRCGSPTSSARLRICATRSATPRLSSRSKKKPRRCSRSAERAGDRREALMATVETLGREVGVKPACEAPRHPGSPLPAGGPTGRRTSIRAKAPKALI